MKVTLGLALLAAALVAPAAATKEEGALMADGHVAIMDLEQAFDDEGEDDLEDDEEMDDDEDEEFLEEGENAQAGRRRRRRRYDWRRRRRRRTGPAPTPPPTWATVSVHPPTKLQMAALALSAYGEACDDDHPAFPGSYGKARNVGNGSMSNKKADPFPLNSSMDIAKRDHGCIVDAAADQYDCTDWWSQWTDSSGTTARTGEYCNYEQYYEPSCRCFRERFVGTGADPNDPTARPCVDEHMHAGSAAKMWVSNPAMASTGTWYSGSLTHSLPENNHVCTIAVRGSDGDDLKAGGVIGGRSYTPDHKADLDHGGQWNVWYTGLNMAIDSKRGLYKYFKTQKVGVGAAQLQALHPECVEMYYCGHSLGGVMASQLALHGYAGQTSSGSWNTHRSYTFGALSFLIGRERVSGQTPRTYVARDHGGFRMVHEQDFAPNLATGSGTTMSSKPQIFMHSTGATAITCNGSWNYWWHQCKTNTNQWNVSGKAADWHSNHCYHAGLTGTSGSSGGKCTLPHHYMGDSYMFLAVDEECFWTNGDSLATGCDSNAGTSVPSTGVTCSAATTDGPGTRLEIDHTRSATPGQVCPLCCMKVHAQGQYSGQGGVNYGNTHGNQNSPCQHCQDGFVDDSACGLYLTHHDNGSFQSPDGSNVNCGGARCSD